jgi:hypothetical protein
MIKKLLTSAFGAAALALVAAAPAHAVVVPFGGSSTGTDPLGGTWSTTNSFKPSWGEPGLGAGTLTFNPGNFSNSAGNYANEFDFTTRFSDLTKGVLWTAVFVSSKEVHFIAPAGSRIDAGDEFFVNVAFTGPVDLEKFSFAALWTDAGTPVPEPATLALLGSGLLGLGLARRRKAA